MKLPDRKHEHDALIVAVAGPAEELASLLCGLLERRELRVELRVVARSNFAPLPLEVLGDAARTVCCVVLAARPAHRPTLASTEEEFLYALLVGPSFPGQVAKLASHARPPRPGEYEIGTLQGDQWLLAEQIAERVAALRRR